MPIKFDADESLREYSDDELWKLVLGLKLTTDDTWRLSRVISARLNPEPGLAFRTGGLTAEAALWIERAARLRTRDRGQRRGPHKTKLGDSPEKRDQFHRAIRATYARVLWALKQDDPPSAFLKDKPAELKASGARWVRSCFADAPRGANPVRARSVVSELLKLPVDDRHLRRILNRT